MRVLGIESSCDETAAAVVDDGPCILTNIIHSQVAAHAPFGGIVPEIASREHVNRILGIVREAVQGAGGLDRLEGIAVTGGPGLVGSLLVGMQFAKGLALTRQLPYLVVNHLEGHLSASLLCEHPPTYPHIALVVSGGHTQLYHVKEFGHYAALGGTRDDAAGEAFDKVAKILGLGYPGGIRIEQAARSGNGQAVDLPRALLNRKSFEFSFSGLKTASAEYVRQRGGRLEGGDLADFCASLQEAIADILTRKAVLAAKHCKASGIVLAGGVGANTRLRELLEARAHQAGLWALAPAKPLCTDNAAMIAAAGWRRLTRGERSAWEQSAQSRWSLGMMTQRGRHRASLPPLIGER